MSNAPKMKPAEKTLGGVSREKIIVVAGFLKALPYRPGLALSCLDCEILEAASKALAAAAEQMEEQP